MKDELRIQLKKLRSAFGGPDRSDADGKIFEIFMNEFGGADSFFIYNSFASEADTKRIISALVSSGKSVYLPRVDGKFMSAVPYGNLKKGAFGIGEPTGQAFNGDVDVTVIPLLGINGKGYRIGYGGGYYDRYLKNAHTRRVGLGYSFQTVAFDEDGWDIPLDLFVCEKGIYRYENNFG